jgi:hypothetical protein
MIRNLFHSSRTELVENSIASGSVLDPLAFSPETADSQRFLLFLPPVESSIGSDAHRRMWWARDDEATDSERWIPCICAVVGRCCLVW